MKKLAPRSTTFTKTYPGSEKAMKPTPQPISFAAMVTPADYATVLNCGPLPEAWSVTETAEAAKALWEEDAATMIAWCALSAYCDDATEEYRFWFRVFAFLKAGSSTIVLEAMAEMADGHPLS